jgi:hypothetical protein
MPERARHMIRMVTTGLMFLAVLMLSAAQIPFEASGYAHHAHGARHHLAVDTSTGSSSAPCSDRCDHHGHTLACCMASCTVASVSLPTDPHKAKPASDVTVAYQAAVYDSPLGIVPDPALRPPERVG